MGNMELNGKNQKQILKIQLSEINIFLILILALLRVYGLSTMGLGVDETLTIKQAQFSQISYLAKQ